MKWPWQRDNGGDAARAAEEAAAQLRDAHERTAEVERVDRLTDELVRRASWFTREFERSMRRRRGTT